MNKTTEALKLAENTLRDIIRVYEFEGGTPVTALAAIREALDHSGDANEMVMDWSKVKPEAIKSDPMYQMGYAAAKAEPVKQEPVAIVVEVDRHGDATVVSGAWQLDGGTHTFYAAPVDAKAIRAEALEEAAKLCDAVYDKYPQPRIAATCAAAIRGLK